MATEANKVRFGLKNVHYAKITGWSDDGLTPTYAAPVAMPGAVNLSIDPNGENENFYADDGVYYVINNNAGYTGELELALIPQSFRKDILGEQEDKNGLIVEKSNVETSQFALLFEFTGDKKKIRHVLYCCTASRPGTSGKTTEDTKEPDTESISISSVALPNELVKAKTGDDVNDLTYQNWYNSVTMPDFTGTGD